MKIKTKLTLFSLAAIFFIVFSGTAAAGGSNGPDPIPTIKILDVDFPDWNLFPQVAGGAEGPEPWPGI